MDYRNWIGFFILGTINNLPYVIVTSAASTIADSFDKRNLVGLVLAANVGLSAVAKALNGFLLLKTPYWCRFLANGFIMWAGLFGVAYAFNFYFALSCIIFVGGSAAFGENVALGFLKHYPSKLVNAWSSGTGMAGLLGSSIYVAFGCYVDNSSDKKDQLKTLTKYSFLLTTPIVLLYLAAYFFILRKPEPVPYESINNQDDNGQSDLKTDTTNSIQDVPTEHGCRRVLRCLKLVLWLSANLAAVYFFEYIVQACASKVRPEKDYNTGCPELYASLQLCYQASVFVSRSSIQILPIHRVEVLSVLQAINMVLWMTDVPYKYLPVYVLPVLMVYVGLLGGASYVNIFYRLLNEESYSGKDRELCINIAALFITVGILFGTGFETIMAATAFKND
ncbi:hypothetical protein ScPMuIL_016448 [Solemya velum]